MLAKILESEGEICAAQNLLYSVYYLELGWEPSSNNPSGIKVCHQTKRFIDDFDDEAIWIGIVQEGIVIACARMIIPFDGSKFELECYREVPKFLKDTKSAEVCRVAVARGYRKNSPTSMILFRAIAVLAHQQKLSYFFTAASARLSVLYRKIGMRLIEEKPFRYSERDEEECYLLKADIHSWWQMRLAMAKFNIAIFLCRGKTKIERGELDRL